MTVKGKCVYIIFRNRLGEGPLYFDYCFLLSLFIFSGADLPFDSPFKRQKSKRESSCFVKSNGCCNFDDFFHLVFLLHLVHTLSLEVVVSLSLSFLFFPHLITVLGNMVLRFLTSLFGLFPLTHSLSFLPWLPTDEASELKRKNDCN